MHCAGNTEIITPNLDRLAQTGTRFSNFFCASPVCSPARATLLTGRIPSQHGIHDWIADGDMGSENTIGWLKQKHTTEYLHGITGYTDVLAETGWNCGLSGKWHLGDSRRMQKGFSSWYVHQCGGNPYYKAPMIRDGELVNEEAYITNVITDEGIRYMEEMKDNKDPFYLSVHYTAPHSPWIDNHPDEYVSMYDDCPFESVPKLPPHSWFKGSMDSEKLILNLKGYYAAITAMDANIGRLLDWLEGNHLRENTLVVFTSDNGYSFGHHGIIGKGNGTFPINMYEEAVKVPTIFSQPSRIPENIVCDSLLSAYDFMPTLLDYVNVKQPANSNLPGHSFKPLLLGELMSEREDVVVYDEYGPVRMVRTKRWKYVHRYPYGPHELYDLENDPAEMNNKVDDIAIQDVVYELSSRLENWFTRYVDPTMDGVREPVTGKGQLNWAGNRGRSMNQYNRI